MAIFRNINDLPMTIVNDGLKLIVNDNGMARQVMVTDIVPKPVKKALELMHEWNFSAEDEVWMMVENINSDLSWMTPELIDDNWIFVVECYTRQRVSTEPEEWQLTDNYITSHKIRSGNPFVSVFIDSSTGEFVDMGCRAAGYCGYLWGDDTVFGEIYTDMYVSNKMHVIYNGDEQTFMPVEVGGVVAIEAGHPIKSVKIYKIKDEGDI